LERHPKQLASILKRVNHHLESAMAEWEAWREFRRVNKAETITAETVKDLVAAGVAEWKGADKEGRPCLLVTGRRLTQGVPRLPALWKQFMIYVAESGLRNVLDSQMAVEGASGDTTPIVREAAGSPSPAASTLPPDSQIVILYDRRGLEFDNIDINLYRDCQVTLSNVRRFYSDRLHCFYVLHMTWGHWFMYYVLLKPLLGLTGRMDKFIAVEDDEDLLPYFPPSQLDLLHPFYSGKVRTVVLPGAGDPTSSILDPNVLSNLPVMMAGGQTAVEPASTTLPDPLPSSR